MPTPEDLSTQDTSPAAKQSTKPGTDASGPPAKGRDNHDGRGSGDGVPGSHLGRAWLALRMVFTPNHVALAAPILMVAYLGWQQRWVSDDGWINIRVVDQVLGGNGPVFNFGERVEVTTSTIWFWMLLAGARILPGTEAQITGVVVGWLLTLLGMVTATVGATRLFRDRGKTMLLPVGTLAMAAIPPFWDFATSGLETGLSFCWLGVCFWLLTRRIGSDRPVLRLRPLRRWPFVAAAWIALGPLIRPDFGLYSVAFALALLATDFRGWWRWIICFTVGALPLVIYQIWRMGYYASLVPNTALAKDAGTARWDQGLIYLIDYAGLYTLLAPMLICLIGSYLHLFDACRARDFGRAAVVLAPVLAGLAHGLYIVRVGGDFMHARFLLPDTWAVMLPLAVIGVGRIRREAVLTTVAFVAGWAVAVAGGTRMPYEGIGPDGISNERGYYAALTTRHKLVTRNDWLGNPFARGGLLAKWDFEAGWSYYETGDERMPSRTGSGVYVAHYNMGILAVLAGNNVVIVDKLALADPVTSHSVVDPRLRDPKERVGHEPRPEAWRTARYAAARPDEPPSVEHARHALNCGDLALLQLAISEPLTPERFWANVALAPRLTSFTFPADPAEARKALCGWQPGW
ncbi:hypothetical protein [Enemella dayhoffiae]|nr:hypothetical protein [Enemella dayhoffiae]